jgi:hypothetical protein
LLIGRQSSDAELKLYQSKTVGVTEVRHQYRFETEGGVAAARIRTLIDSIGRSVQSLNYDIETEEQRTQCSDCRDPAYSVVARNLAARRDNLVATIAALQKRADAGAQTFTPIGSAKKPLLPARG